MLFKKISIITTTFLMLINIIFPSLSVLAQENEEISNFSLSSSEIKADHTKMDIRFDYSSKSKEDSTIIVKIPDILAATENDISIASDIIEKQDIKYNHVGENSNGQPLKWNQGYWEVILPIISPDHIESGDVKISLSTPAYGENNKQDNVPIELYQNSKFLDRLDVKINTPQKEETASEAPHEEEIETNIPKQEGSLNEENDVNEESDINDQKHSSSENAPQGERENNEMSNEGDIKANTPEKEVPVNEEIDINDKKQSLSQEKAITNLKIEPSVIKSNNTIMSIKFDTSFNANDTSLFKIRIPDILVGSSDEISLHSDIVNGGSIKYNHIGNPPSGKPLKWNNGFWEITFSLDAQNQAGVGSIDITLETLQYGQGYKNGPFPIEIYQNEQLVESSNVTISISEGGVGIATKSISNSKFPSNSPEVQQARKAKEHNPNYIATDLSESLGVGSISLSDDSKNLTTIGFTAYLMDKNGPKGVTISDELPEGISITKPQNLPEGHAPMTDSGFVVQQVRMDISDPYNLKEIPGTTKWRSSEFKEVGGNFGDPLAPQQIRITTDKKTNRQHFEANIGKVEKDARIYFKYYQHVDKVPEPPVYGILPEFVNVAEVNWDGGPIYPVKVMTWQTVMRSSSSSYTASKSVDKSDINLGDELTYKIRLSSFVDGLFTEARDNVPENLPIIEESITVDNPLASYELDKEKNRIILRSEGMGKGETVNLTFKVDTSNANYGEKLKNSFYLFSTSEDSLLLGNTVTTEVIGAPVTVKYVDEDGYSVAEDIVLTGKLDEKYTTEAKEIETYVLKETPVNATGVFTDKEQTVIYVYKKTPVDPTDPGIPIDPVDPTDPEGPNPGTKGPLSIDYASSLDFGKTKITSTDKTYTAAAQKFNSERGDGPNYVQIRDNRETKTGWSLQVKQNGQFKSTSSKELTGAEITFKNSMVNTISTSLKPSIVKSSFSLTPEGDGVAESVMSAKSGEGVGTYVLAFGDDSTAADSIELSVPGKTTKYAEKYSTSLTWTLMDVPGQ
ncbi:hypothetical protein IEQ_04957 [Bacillus cereus BAG6X1-2]|nr:hypothetical protein IEQ_04957 [Bacillus cereus BAG6X1-2]